MRQNPQETADLVTFTEEILNRKLYFLCSVCTSYLQLLKKFLGIMLGGLYETSVRKNARLSLYNYPILVQCHISIPPENGRKPKVF